MNIKSINRIVIVLGTIFILAFSSITIGYAATSSELQNKQSDIDKKIDKINSEISGVKAEQNTTLSQINKLNVQITSYEGQISTLNQRLSDINAQIQIKTDDLAVQEAKYNSQKEALEKRLVAMYETGTTNYLDMLLSSDGFADFVSRYYLISQIAEYDQELLENIDNTKKSIEAEKEYLESAKNEVVETKSSLESTKKSLATSVSEKNSIVQTLTAEEKELQDELEQFEKDKKEIAAQLAAIAKKNNYTTSVTPSAAGYISPLAGRTKANITTGYMGYRGHTGVDFAIAGGTPILAVKSGKVVISTALKYSNGKYRSYGEYVVIDHLDGTMTLYAHMTANSRRVSVGQMVSQGQTIGLIGSTGNSSGNHLHFEVRVNGSPVNPTPYLP